MRTIDIKGFKTVNFEDIKIGQSFMIYGGGTRIKRDEDTARDIKGYNLYRFSFNTKVYLKQEII